MNPEVKKSVLIVEDHSDSCQILKQMLRRRGLHAECAESMAEGITALEIAEDQGYPFSCLVSDLALSDSNALQSVETLGKLKERTGIPVRAISGIQDPEVIEACRKARIPLILKGTSAEGIMESVLYAIAEREPGHEIDEMIADNRAHSREIKNGFFQKWSALTKFCAAAGVIISTSLAAMSLGGWLYHRLEDNILKRRESDTHFEQLDERVKVQDVRIAENAERIRKREDSALKIEGKIDDLVQRMEENKRDFAKQLDRIESKVDRK